MFHKSGSDSGKEKVQDDEIDPWKHLESFANVAFEGQSSHYGHGHQTKNQGIFLDHFQHPQMSTSSFPYAQPHNDRQHIQSEEASNFHYGMTADLPWAPETDWNHSHHVANALYPSHPEYNQDPPIYHPHSIPSNFHNDGSSAGVSSTSGHITGQKDRKAQFSTVQSTSKSQQEVSSVLKKMERFLQAPLHEAHSLAYMIPSNNVFESYEFTRNLTPQQFQVANDFALLYPPGSLTTIQRADRRKSLRTKGVPLGKKTFLPALDRESELLRRQANIYNRKVKNLENKFAREIEENKSISQESSESEEDPEIHRLAHPSTVEMSKDASLYLYIKPEDIAELNEARKAELEAFYQDYPLHKSLPPIHSHERHVFYKRRHQLQKMGIPLPVSKKGRPLLDKSDSDAAKEKKRQRDRVYVARRRAEQKARIRKSYNESSGDDTY